MCMRAAYFPTDCILYILQADTFAGCPCALLPLAFFQVVNTVKGLEKQGYTFEGADASVNLLVRRTMSGYVPPFK